MSKDQIPNTTPQEQFRHDVLPPYEAYMSDKGTKWLFWQQLLDMSAAGHRVRGVEAVEVGDRGTGTPGFQYPPAEPNNPVNFCLGS